MSKQKTNPKQPESNDIKDLIKNLLAEHIGCEPDDIDEGDAFTEDLHMSATDLADFMQTLEAKGIETSSLDLPSLKTLGDLIESISSEELIE